MTVPRRAVAVALALACPLPLTAQGLTSTLLAGSPGGGGFQDGAGADARLSSAFALAVDSGGRLVIGDFGNHAIRVAGTGNELTTYAGLMGVPGSTDGPVAAARFTAPQAIAFDASGALFVAEASHTIRRIGPDGTVTTVAGLAGVAGTTDGTGAAARFNSPRGLAFDAAGNLYVSELRSHTIRRITPDGTVSTLAGLAGSAGFADGQGTAARFSGPRQIAIDRDGTLLVADSGNNRIRRVTPGGLVSTIAGSGAAGYADGAAAAAMFSSPRGVASDTDGNVYVADTNNNNIRRIAPGGAVTTFSGQWPLYGTLDGPPSFALYLGPSALVPDGAGGFYVADQSNNLIRRLAPGGSVVTVIGLNDARYGNGTGSDARFQHPEQVAAAPDGSLYVADGANAVVRKVSPDGTVDLFAGRPQTFGTEDGPRLSASFSFLHGVALDAAGNLYLADWGNHDVRKVDTAGLVTRIAGKAGESGSADGPAASARFNHPQHLAFDDASGSLYITDLGNHTVRRLRGGVVTTLAGSAGQRGSADGAGAEARFNNPTGLAVDAAGTLYVADQSNQTIRRITPAGVVTTLAGKAGSQGNVDGQGDAARFSNPSAVAVDAAGSLYVTDVTGSILRRITPDGQVTTVLGIPEASRTSNGCQEGSGDNARLFAPQGIAVGPGGRVFVSDWSGNAIYLVTPALSASARIDTASGPRSAPRQLDCVAPGATSYRWTVLQRPTGSSASVSPASERNPTFTPDVVGTYQLECRATHQGASGFSVVSFRATEAPAAVTRTIPIVLDVVGRGDAHFTSQAVLANAGATPASLKLTYTAANTLSGAGTGSAEETLPAGGQLVLGDALAYLRGKGLQIPDVSAGAQGGSLRVEFTGIATLESAFAGARTTAPSGSGRAGLAYPGLSLEEAGASGLWLFGLRENEADRSNLALVNLGTRGEVTLVGTVFPGAGGQSRELPAVTLGPGQWHQLNSVLAAAGLSSGYALVTRVSGSEPWSAYAVFNDNKTSDGSFVAAVRTDRLPERQVLPVLVETSTFRSELILGNPGAQALTVSLTYVESLTPSGTAPVTVSETLQPGEQRILPEAIAYLRGKGAAVGAAGPSYAGALLVRFRTAEGANAAGFVGARTGAPAPEGGQYGLFYPGLGLSEAAEREAYVFGLQQDDSARSNLAVVNAGTGGGSITLQVELHDGATGAKAFTSEPIVLAPGAWRQLNGILGLGGLAAGYARVVKLSGEGRFAAYGVVNDGSDPSRGTNDGSYVAGFVVR